MEQMIAQRYASSFFEVATEADLQKQIWEELGWLDTVFKENPELFKLLVSPLISLQEKIGIIGKIFTDQVHQYTLNFIQLLCDKKRIAYFTDIAEEYEQLYFNANAIQRVAVTTAIPLSETLRNKLIRKLEQITSCTILLQEDVDPAVIGGIVVKMNNEQMDASVKARLDRLKAQLTDLIA